MIGVRRKKPILGGGRIHNVLSYFLKMLIQIHTIQGSHPIRMVFLAICLFEVFEKDEGNSLKNVLFLEHVDSALHSCSLEGDTGHPDVCFSSV